MLRKTYAVVHLENIAHNIRALRKIAGREVMAVVKADAYGHGMREVSLRAQKEGVRWFGVATADEAVAFRMFSDANLLVLSPVDEVSMQVLLKKDVSICVYDLQEIMDIEAFAKAENLTAKVHLKIDTGMHRVGVQNLTILEEILSFLNRTNHISLEGVFTHFAKADSKDISFSKMQLSCFEAAVAQVKKAGFAPLVHAANSAATIALPESRYDLCRLGIAMYGYAPSEEVDTAALALKPGMSLYSHVTQVKNIAGGECVGYGATYKAKQEETIATVPIGYADGYRRGLSNKAYAFIAGEKALIAGRVCMDQSMFVVTGLNISVGDRIELLGEHVSADLHGAWADTISYEILTGISNRVPRIYDGI